VPTTRFGSPFSVLCIKTQTQARLFTSIAEKHLSHLLSVSLQQTIRFRGFIMSSEDALRAYLELYQRRQREVPQALVRDEPGPSRANAFSSNSPTSTSDTFPTAWRPPREGLMLDHQVYTGKTHRLNIAGGFHSKHRRLIIGMEKIRSHLYR
jgi:hypothetical protein